MYYYHSLICQKRFERAVLFMDFILSVGNRSIYLSINRSYVHNYLSMLVYLSFYLCMSIFQYFHFFDNAFGDVTNNKRIWFYAFSTYTNAKRTYLLLNIISFSVNAPNSVVNIYQVSMISYCKNFLSGFI